MSLRDPAAAPSKRPPDLTAAGAHDERIVARDFDDWLEARQKKNG